MVLALAINVSVKGGTNSNDNSAMKQKIDKNSKPSAAPSNSPITLPAAPLQQPAGPKKP